MRMLDTVNSENTCSKLCYNLMRSIEKALGKRKINKRGIKTLICAANKLPPAGKKIRQNIR